METLVGTTRLYGDLSPPLKIAEMYYTHHGVPINEDKTWDYANRYSLRTAGIDDGLYVREGYTSAYLNFDREPRFYAGLGFDGGVWYGHGKYNDRSEEHTSELQSLMRISYAVFCLKKKKQ